MSRLGQWSDTIKTDFDNSLFSSAQQTRDYLMVDASWLFIVIV